MIRILLLILSVSSPYAVGFLSYNIRSSSRSSSSSVGSLRMVATLTPPAVAAQAATSPPVPTVATSTTTSSTTSSTTTRPTEQKLSVAARLSRAASFYSAAVPIFASYKMLDQVTKWRKTVLNEDVTEAEVEAQFQQLHDWGSDKIADKIKELKGFYVKTGQIISTRVDIFPEQYTSKLASTQDALDPLPAEVVKEVVRTELLGGADLSELFAEFDDVPLGSASIAQVHRAKLLDGRVVAVKVQRPGIAPKLLGDIANLKNFAKIVGDALPIDYYKVFCEIENTLVYELDFLFEAQATAKVAAAVAHSPSNKPRKPPVLVPLPIPGLVSTKVMVLEFVDGIALSKLAAEMTSRGVKPGSPESLLFGRKLLGSLTDAYSSMIFGSGIIHGDPHPGNIFILRGSGDVCLLDCGQVKQLTTAQRLGLAGLIVQVNDWEQEQKNGESPELERRTKLLADTVRSFGVTFKEGAGDDCAAAVALVLFGNSDTVLPGGWAGEEISPNSPINQVSEFPQELVLLGRATVMIRGIANRLGLAWGLSDRWSKEAKEAIAAASTPSESLPIWSVAAPTIHTPEGSGLPPLRLVAGRDRVRFTDVSRAVAALFRLVQAYVTKKVALLAQKYVPESVLRAGLKWYVKLFNGGAATASR